MRRHTVCQTVNLTVDNDSSGLTQHFVYTTAALLLARGSITERMSERTCSRLTFADAGGRLVRGETSESRSERPNDSLCAKTMRERRVVRERAGIGMTDAVLFRRKTCTAAQTSRCTTHSLSHSHREMNDRGIRVKGTLSSQDTAASCTRLQLQRLNPETAVSDGREGESRSKCSKGLRYEHGYECRADE